MIMIWTMSMILLTITFVLIIMSSIFSKKSFLDREKLSPFECGFSPKTPYRNSFSLHFFLISVIFMVFDLEIILLISMVPTMKITNLLNYLLIMMFFLLILLMGLYHEWNQKMLKWTL